jgi:hypothetical protein
MGSAALDLLSRHRLIEAMPLVTGRDAAGRAKDSLVRERSPDECRARACGKGRAGRPKAISTRIGNRRIQNFSEYRQDFCAHAVDDRNWV